MRGDYHLREQERTAVVQALHDAADIYRKLSEQADIPERLQRQFGSQQEMARGLADLIEQAGEIVIRKDAAE